MSDEKSIRQMSKEDIPGSRTWDNVRIGAILRIADSAELMARNYRELLEERERFERYWRMEESRRIRAERSNAALRGYITRLKRK